MYGAKPLHRNLDAYFPQLKLPNIQLPNRRYYTTNDPVMAPELLDYFSDVRTQCFANQSERKQALLHSIYDLPEYKVVLPKLEVNESCGVQLRQHRRYSLKSPNRLTVALTGQVERYPLQVIEVSS